MTDPTPSEYAYYLPPTTSKLAEEWQKKGDQNAYAAYSVAGHRLVANAIIEAKKRGEDISIETLYRIAAKARRAIAILNQPADYDKFRYGKPLSSTQGAMADYIYSKAGTRYHEHFDEAYARLGEIISLQTAGYFQSVYGNEYFAIDNNVEGSQRSLSIYDTQTSERIASISHHYDPEYLSGSICLAHASPSTHSHLYNKANQALTRILRNSSDEKEFWHDMAEISLNLNHATPLLRGSQATCQMVLAGIMLASGYPVTPCTPEMDHFIDAEIIPPHSYRTTYQQRFRDKPEYQGAVTKPFEADTGFLTQADQAMQEIYRSISCPVKRLEAYLDDAGNIYHSSTELDDVVVENGKIIATARSSAQQPAIDHALSFIGHDEIITQLDLPIVQCRKRLFIDTVRKTLLTEWQPGL